jgi:predicted nucleotidyltransferase
MGAVRGLDILFGTKARTALLRRLARETLPLSARQLAELTGLTHRTVIAALEPLVDDGLVIMRAAGPAYQYCLQREHVIVATVLLPALAAEDRLPGLMAEELVALFSPVAASIILFGSAARNEDVPGSDVDVLVVTSSAGECGRIEESLEAERARFFRRFGRPLSVHCLAPADLSGPWPPFVAEAAGNGVLLFGKGVAKLRPSHG